MSNPHIRHVCLFYHLLTQVASEAEFNQLLSSPDSPDSPALTMVEFTAPWCGPARKLAPAYASLSEDFPTLRFLKVDIQALESLGARFNVTSMPNIAVLKQGQEIERVTDSEGSENIMKRLREICKSVSEVGSAGSESLASDVTME